MKKDNKYIAIGDIHGSISKLKVLLKKIGINKKIKEGYKIIFLGDYINKGEDSFGTIEFLINLKEKYNDNVIFLKGNHEYTFLKIYEDNLKGTLKKELLDKFLNKNGLSELIDNYKKGSIGIGKEELIEFIDGFFIPKKHFEFFKNLLTYYETKEYFFVHAGNNGMNLNEIKIGMRDNKNKTEYDILWDRNLPKVKYCEFNFEKVIVTGHNPVQNHKKWDNVMGAREVGYKQTIAEESIHEYFFGKLQEYGFENYFPIITDKAILLDTGCFRSGKLTGYDCQTKKFKQT